MSSIPRSSQIHLRVLNRHECSLKMPTGGSRGCVGPFPETGGVSCFPEEGGEPARAPERSAGNGPGPNCSFGDLENSVRLSGRISGRGAIGASLPYSAGKHDERQEASDAWVISEPSHR